MQEPEGLTLRHETADVVGISLMEGAVPFVCYKTTEISIQFFLYIYKLANWESRGISLLWQPFSVAGFRGGSTLLPHAGGLQF